MGRDLWDRLPGPFRSCPSDSLRHTGRKGRGRDWLCHHSGAGVNASAQSLMHLPHTVDARRTRRGTRRILVLFITSVCQNLNCPYS